MKNLLMKKSVMVKGVPAYAGDTIETDEETANILIMHKMAEEAEPVAEIEVKAETKRRSKAK